MDEHLVIHRLFLDIESSDTRTRYHDGVFLGVLVNILGDHKFYHQRNNRLILDLHTIGELIRPFSNITQLEALDIYQFQVIVFYG